MLNRHIIAFCIGLFVIALSYGQDNKKANHTSNVQDRGQSRIQGSIRGHISLSQEWEPVVYISYIPTFDEMYSMSNEMIISETAIDSMGNFFLDLSFLPKEMQLFRLHITKQGDSKNSLIIGGKDENFLFFIAHRYSQIVLKANQLSPPFKHSIFTSSDENNSFQKITNLVYEAEQIASESGASKRQFVEDKMQEELLIVADSASQALSSLYAIYCSNFEANIQNNLVFYKAYAKKWQKENNAYFKAFRQKLPFKTESTAVWIYVLASFLFVGIGFLLGKFSKKKKGFKTLSVQERKIFELLKEGASNQEISDALNIGLSTVKSHVSSIFTKMNVKSRKDIMNLK